MKKLVVSEKVTKELLNCVKDVLNADGDLDAMDFDRYRQAIHVAYGDIKKKALSK